jgi:hypothetical protein
MEAWLAGVAFSVTNQNPQQQLNVISCERKFRGVILLYPEICRGTMGRRLVGPVNREKTTANKAEALGKESRGWRALASKNGRYRYRSRLCP